MSEDVEHYTGNIECLAENLKKIKGILDKEPSPEHLHELGDAVMKTLQDMSPIHGYYENLRDEVRIYHTQNKAKELRLLFRPIKGSYLTLDTLKMNIDLFSMTLENIRRKGPTENTPQTTRRLVEFGKFWEDTKSTMRMEEAGVRHLIDVLSIRARTESI